MTFSDSFVNKVVIVKQFLGLRESAQKVLDIHMYEYMDIYDIALMPLDALSAIAFDLPPNEFQLDPRYISSAFAPFVSVSDVPQLCHQSPRNGIALFERPHACVSDGLQCLTKMFSLKRQTERS